MRTTWRAAVAVSCLLAAAGCERSAEPQQQVAACAGASAARPAGTQVKLEFRQGGKVVASGSIPVGGVFQAGVPQGTNTEVYAGDELLGSSEEGSYLNGGPGCPDSPTG